MPDCDVVGLGKNIDCSNFTRIADRTATTLLKLHITCMWVQPHGTVYKTSLITESALYIDAANDTTNLFPCGIA